VTATRFCPESRDLARSDDEILGEIKAGDLVGIGELFDRYARTMWRAVHRTMGSSTDVDDIIQRVFLKLPELACSYDGRSNAGPWLVGIAVRTALRHRRGTGRFFRMLASFAQTVSPHAAGDPEEHSSQRQELRMFQTALAKLTPKKRVVFALVELEGLTTEQVATALEIPPATVRTRLHHARRELYAAVGRDREE
jgi:RNA polymerase sigma-70 factor (ECF subfamily)